ncbi:MAG: site-specific integrase [Nitrosomonadaceae bacterium]|nr:site-specific integrase [Nitrosomonadaceae bacterium]
MVSKFNFTKAAIEALPLPLKGWKYYYDLKVQGLGIGIGSSGKKTFILYRKINGRPERITLGRYPDLTIEQARGKASEINSDIANGLNPADFSRESKREMTLDDLFHEYMVRTAAFNKRPDKPEANYRLYLSPWGKRKLSSIKHEEVDSLHKKLGRDKGVVTANIALKLLHVMYNKAINEWRIWKGENAAHGIKKFTEKSRDRFLQGDELPRFFQALAEEQNDTMRDYFLLALLTGARRSNVLAMQWSDVNLDRAEWRIEETKNGTPQTVTLSPEAVDLLRNRKPAEPDTFVFPGSGKTGHLMEPKKAWKRILERAGIEDLRIHDLRRTLGSWQAKTGASLSIIGKSLNHKNQSTTAIYARLDLDPVRDSVNTATSAMLQAAGLKSSSDIVKKTVRNHESKVS